MNAEVESIPTVHARIRSGALIDLAATPPPDRHAGAHPNMHGAQCRAIDQERLLLRLTQPRHA
eukprot:8628995-Alexandrium_andersonii.AAC.1